MNDPTKPGYTTTEWWGQMLAHIFAVAVGLSGIFGWTVSADRLSALVPGIAALAAELGAAWYSYSRSKVKTAALGYQAVLPAGEHPVRLPARVGPAMGQHRG